MNKNLLGIADGGERRLHKFVEAQVRAEHQDELAAAVEYWRKAAIEDKIAHEVEARMKDLTSPQSLWLGHWLSL